MAKKLLITKFFPPAIGGIENYYLNFCNRLDPQEIVVLADTHPLSEEFDKNQKYKIYRADFFGGKVSPRWRPLKSAMADIIKAEGIGQILFGHFHPLCLLGAKFNLPYVVFGHGTDITQIKNNFWQKFTFKKVVSHYNCQSLITNSQFLADEMSKLLPNNSKIKIVYPGINFEPLSKIDMSQVNDKKKLLNFDNDDVILLSLGRIEAEKNFAAIIKLMPEMLAKIPQLKYLIVGGGSQLEELKALAQNYGLRHQVIFTGAINDSLEAKKEYYQMAHVFITASLRPEGFGISYLEAQAAKTVVIASKLGGSAEAVKDNETGLLVDPNNTEEIKQAIYKAVLDRDLWNKLSANGVEWAHNFDWDNQIDQLKNILG